MFFFVSYRSANYYKSTGICELSEMDRITLAGSNSFQPNEGKTTSRLFKDCAIKRHFNSFQKLVANKMLIMFTASDYLENNCAEEPNKLCEFKRLSGRILKTVDSVYQDVSSVDECRELCLNSPYR